MSTQPATPSTMRTAGLRALLAVLLLAGTALFTSAVPAQADSVCTNVKDGTARSQPFVYKGQRLGTIWFHERTVSPRGCYVFQTDLYRGTPHWMSFQVCDTVNPVSGCTRRDEGNFSLYAGPLYTDPTCNSGYLDFRRPDGTVLFRGYFVGMPDICG